MVDITNPIFHDEAKATAHLEASRWPNGPFCPYCGQLERVAKLGGQPAGCDERKCGQRRRDDWPPHLHVRVVRNRTKEAR